MALGEILARPMIAMLNDLKWKIDLVTAVPMGVARQAERGYNQAALLALSLALGSKITYQPRALSKARETRSQVGLTITERRKNVVGAFQARTNIVRGRCLLVVDDVTTSGATMEACSSTLLEAGAREVYGLTLARAA
jgi:ComF family protein